MRPGHSAPAAAGRAIRVLIVTGETLARAGYRVLLESDGRIEVVAEAVSGDQAIALAEQTRPDVVLLDLELPGLDQLDETRRIVSHEAFAAAAVMVIAPSESDETVLSALRAGAVGVLAKDATPAELRRAVQALAGGEAMLPAIAARRLISELSPQRLNRRSLAEQLAALTEREREVAALVSMGLTNGEIAERLVISPATAKTHVSRVRTKLRARHRAELVAFAYDTGLVPPAPAGPSPAGGS
jgi:DNA-binding NarL/FixJ family response regulator